MPKVIVIAAIM